MSGRVDDAAVAGGRRGFPHNVILIEADMMPWFCLGIAGSPNVRTPHLDRLAADGALFQNACCQHALCVPSRISMLAGQYASTTRQFGFTGLCDRRMPWLPERLRSEGYHTAAFGKFHVGPVGADDFGFDVAGATLPEDEDFARPHGYTYRAYCNSQGIAYPTDQGHGHDPLLWPGSRRPSSWTEDLPRARRGACRSDVPVEHSLETWTTDQAIRYLSGRRGQDGRFFMWLTYDRPHGPSRLPGEWFERIRPDELVLPPLPTAETLAALPRGLFDVFAKGHSVLNWGEADFRFVLATYLTLIEWIDSEIGRVLETLNQTGLSGDTTVIFTTDHGDEAGFNGLYDKDRGIYSEALTHVPLIVRAAPCLRPAARSSPFTAEPVEGVDLFPTVCSLLGLEIPAQAEGRDLAPHLLEGVPLDPQRAVVCEDFYGRMICRDGWRLVFDAVDDECCQLHCLAEDPHQFRDRYRDAGSAPIRMRLKRALLAFLMQRLFGPYNEADVERVERGLDGKDPLVPLHTTFEQLDQVHACRSAAFIVGRTHKLFVPFYSEDLLLFALDGPQPPPLVQRMFSVREHAVPLDVDVAETLLDRGLRQCMSRIQPISIMRRHLPKGSAPAAREIQELLGRRE